MDKDTTRKSLEYLKLKKEEIIFVARAEFLRKRRLLEQRFDIFTEMFRKELIDLLKLS
jgi:adenine/guanine phosphoribosyltransferase-like PRPP-binding protein